MKSKKKLIKIALERVQRTDLICIACGNFRTEWAIMPSIEGIEPAAGVHTKCIPSLHVKRTRNTKSATTAPGDKARHLTLADAVLQAQLEETS
jgi:hypothetical protein